MACLYTSALSTKHNIRLFNLRKIGNLHIRTFLANGLVQAERGLL